MWTYALQLLYKLLGLQMEGGTLHWDTPQESTHDYGDREGLYESGNNMGVSLNGGTLKTSQNHNF